VHKNIYGRLNKFNASKMFLMLSLMLPNVFEVAGNNNRMHNLVSKYSVFSVLGGLIVGMLFKMFSVYNVV